MVMAVMWTLAAIATVVVVVRLVVRKKMGNFGLDDGLTGISMVILFSSSCFLSPFTELADMPKIFVLAFAAASTVSIHYGYGQHYNTLNSKHSSTALLWNTISFVFGMVAFALPKLAVAAHLDRIWGQVLSFQSRITMWGLPGAASLISLGNILIYITECSPTEALWTPDMAKAGEAHCRDIWILIHFATFNGGEAFNLEAMDPMANKFCDCFTSLLCICGSISCSISMLCFYPLSSSNAAAQKAHTVCGVWLRFHVRLPPLLAAIYLISS